MPEQEMSDFVRGDTWTNKIVLTKEGSPIDITGDQFWVTLKLNPVATDAEADAQREVTASGADATNGIVYVTLDAVDTVELTPGRYHYDIQRKAGNAVQTLLYGRVRVVRDITRDYA